MTNTAASLGSGLVIVDIICIMRAWRESREIVGKSEAIEFNIREFSKADG